MAQASCDVLKGVSAINRLPRELRSLTLDCVVDDVSTLRAVSQVNKAWRDATLPRLFETIDLDHQCATKERVELFAAMMQGLPVQPLCIFDASPEREYDETRGTYRDFTPHIALLFVLFRACGSKAPSDHLCLRFGNAQQWQNGLAGLTSLKHLPTFLELGGITTKGHHSFHSVTSSLVASALMQSETLTVLRIARLTMNSSGVKSFGDATNFLDALASIPQLTTLEIDACSISAGQTRNGPRYFNALRALVIDAPRAPFGWIDSLLVRARATLRLLMFQHASTLNFTPPQPSDMSLPALGALDVLQELVLFGEFTGEKWLPVFGEVETEKLTLDFDDLGAEESLKAYSKALAAGAADKRPYFRNLKAIDVANDVFKDAQSSDLAASHNIACQLGLNKRRPVHQADTMQVVHSKWLKALHEEVIALPEPDADKPLAAAGGASTEAETQEEKPDDKVKDTEMSDELRYGVFR